MLLPAPRGGWEERSWASTPSQSAVLHEGRGAQSPCHYSVSPPSAQRPSCGGRAWHQIFSSCNSSDVLQLMGKKQGRRDICVPQSSHCQKWCFAKTPWQPSSTTRHLIFMHLSNAHQSLIFCFGTTTWVLLLPSCTSVLLKSACCDMKWKLPKADVAGECWASGSKPKQNLVNALKKKIYKFPRDPSDFNSWGTFCLPVGAVWVLKGGLFRIPLPQPPKFQTFSDDLVQILMSECYFRVC